jgi:uncharacterized protein (TIGR02996 family)
MPERPEVLAFLREIKDDPDNDAPRLVLADWLEEQGDPRSEFVRLQVERARLAEEDPRRKCLAARERQLLDEHAAAWLGRWHKAAYRWQFDHGLLHLELAASRMARAGRATLDDAATAWVDSLGVSGLPAEVVAKLFPVHALDLSSAGDDSALTAASVPALAGLRRLRMTNVSQPLHPPLSLAPLAELARLETLELVRAGNPYRLDVASLPALPRLRRLRFINCDPRTFEFLDVVASLRLPGLTTLDFDHASSMSIGFPLAFPELPHLGGLTTLGLTGLELRPSTLREVLTSPGFPLLTALNFGENDVGPAGVAELRGVAPAVPLRRLHLGSNRLGEEGAAALAACPLLARLSALFLNHNQIGPRGARALAASPHRLNLATLDLSTNNLGDEGVKALSASEGFPRLTILLLGSAGIGPRGAAALRGPAHLPALTGLDLNRNAVGDEGAAALARSLLLAQLTTLDLSYNDISDEGALALANSPHLRPHLWLNLEGNLIRGRGAGPLRDRLGNQVHFL